MATQTATVSATDFAELLALTPDEVVTHSYVRDVPISGGRILALVTLDKTDLDEPVGQLPASLMNDVARGLRRVLGL